MLDLINFDYTGSSLSNRRFPWQNNSYYTLVIIDVADMKQGLIIAYAKLNIGLIIKEKRKDGFHNLNTFFQLISLSDVIDYEIESSTFPSIEIEQLEGEPYLKNGELDIMEKAAMAFYDATALGFRVKIRISKNIPSGAGLGGGSADGAAVLRILSGFYEDKVSEATMFECALKVGSDVPFLYSQYSASYASGRGEILSCCESVKFKNAVIIVPENKKINTGEAYRKIDALNLNPERTLPHSLDFDISRELFPNDFERVEDYGTLPATIKELAGTCYYSLSGSGSAWFILTRTLDEALTISHKAGEKGLLSKVVSVL